jgi:hypothetical protein
MIASEGFDLTLTSCSAPRMLSNRIDAMHVAKEMDDMHGTIQQRQIAMADDAVGTVVYKTSRLENSLPRVSIGPLLRSPRYLLG